MDRPTDDRWRVWATELSRWWTFFNDEYVRGAMRAPSLEVKEGLGALGTWDGGKRRIAVSAEHILRDEWSEVLDTLRHEMAHQYADEVLHVRGETPHGSAFGHALHHLRVRDRSRDERPGANGAQGVSAKIAKLLTLAGSPNEHEAQVAMNKARELLLKHNIEAVHEARPYRVIQIGPLKKRHQAWEYDLAGILGAYFFVKALWVPSYDAARCENGVRLELYGTPTNLEMAEYVYHFLTGVLERSWAAYKRSQGIRKNRDRRVYYLGLLRGFDAKLAEQDRTFAQSGSRALVIRGDARLNAYYRHLNPRTQSVSGSSLRVTAAFLDGLEDGRAISINKPVSTGPTGFGGYLGAGRRR